MDDQFGECSVPLENAFDLTVVKEEECKNEDIIDYKVQITETAIITKVQDNLMHDKIKQYDIYTNLDNIKTELALPEIQCDMKHDNIKIEEEIGADNIRIEFNNGLLYCEECQVYCEEYCAKCEMLVHILNKTVLIHADNILREELPNDYILEIQHYFGEFHVFALKSIPVGVRFGPFTGLNRTERSYKIKGGKFVVNNDKSKYLNWMQYIKPAKNISEQNLHVFQHEHNLYYESTCRIEKGDELLMYFGKEYEDSLNRNAEMDFIPTTENRIKDVFACTFCCLGFSSKLYLAKHKTICRKNAAGEFTIEDVMQCPYCRIHLGLKEYLMHHMAYCYQKNDRKCDLPTSGNRTAQVNERKTRRHQMYKCQQCNYRTKYEGDLKNHTNQHYEVKTCKCGICKRRFKTKGSLRLHVKNTHVHVGIEGDPERLISDSKNSQIKTETSCPPVDVKRLKCSQCEFLRAKYKLNLKRHTKAKHLKEFDYKCASCEYNVNRKNSSLYKMGRHKIFRKFSCDLCDYTTNKGCMLRRHIKTKHPHEFSYKCQLCSYKTGLKSRLDRHIKETHHPAYKCHLCTFKTGRNSTLELHTKAVHLNEFDYRCDACEFKTNVKRRLTKHVKTNHPKEFDYQCQLCAYKTNLKSDFEQHVKSEHLKELDYKCQLCAYKTVSKSNLSRHVKETHLKEFAYKCHSCTFEARFRSSLAIHMKAVHRKEFDYRCDLCEFRTNRRYCLEKHIKTIHLKEFDYKCQSCAYKTNEKSKFKQHVKLRHFHEFGCKCQLCAFKPAIRSSLDHHAIATRLKESCYRCDSCDYETNRKNRLEKHIKTNHLKEFDYVCELCTYKSNFKANFEKHVKSKHLNEFDYECDLCEYKTNLKVSFKNHLKAKHHDEFDRKCNIYGNNKD